jgi:formylglycine-generating enzyme required for sulfatase activity
MVELDDLSDEQVDALCARYQVVKKQTFDFLKRLRQAVREVGRRGGPDETNLIGNPLLLGSACTVFLELGHLPHDRANLCFQIVAHLCVARRAEIAARGWLLKPDQKRDLLERIALAMQREGAQTWALGRVHNLVSAWLGDQAHELDHVRQIVKWLVEQTGLLFVLGTDEGEVVRFHHRQFREYLAACRLTRGNQTVEGVLEGLAGGGQLLDPAWLDVVRLIPGALNSEEKASAMGEWFRTKAEKEPENHGPLCALLATVVVESKDLFRQFDSAAFVNKALEKYETEGTQWEQATRLLFLESVGGLGDPRLDPRREDRWRLLHPSRFTMGGVGFQAEHEHEQDIVVPFRLGRFPVTNAEYRVFVQDGGYDRREHWDSDAWEWMQLGPDEVDAWLEARDLPTHSWDPPGKTPAYWGDPDYNQANQPVVGVSWHEARAYCRWLTRQWANDPPPWWEENEPPVVWLPSEAEWEYAARGAKGRMYPWPEGEPSPEHANYDATDLKRTSAVGAFPKGHTPMGLSDMAGNVWEWCRDTWLEDARESRKLPEANPVNSKGDTAVRVLRGGSWFDGADYLRAAVRSGGPVWGRVSGVGFRCCVCRSPEHLEP